jgi:hypothetical protein
MRKMAHSIQGPRCFTLRAVLPEGLIMLASSLRTIRLQNEEDETKKENVAARLARYSALVIASCPLPH